MFDSNSEFLCCFIVGEIVSGTVGGSVVMTTLRTVPKIVVAPLLIYRS